MRATPCVSSFLFASPRLQLLLLPLLQRIDATRASGGKVVGLHVRSGYADFTPDETLAAKPLTLHQAWTALDDLYESVEWNQQTSDYLKSGGLQCSASSAATLGRLQGAFSVLVNCALRKARQNAHWLVYVAGDLLVLSELCSRQPGLSAHVVSAPGRHGHVSEHRLCQTCVTTANPDGAWDRTFVDMWILGAVDEVVRMGHSTFFGAVELRLRTSVPTVWFYTEASVRNETAVQVLYTALQRIWLAIREPHRTRAITQ